MLTFYIYLDKQIHFRIITNILYACKQHSPYADCLTICLSIVMCWISTGIFWLSCISHTIHLHLIIEIQVDYWFVLLFSSCIYDMLSCCRARSWVIGFAEFFAINDNSTGENQFWANQEDMNSKDTSAINTLLIQLNSH